MKKKPAPHHISKKNLFTELRRIYKKEEMKEGELETFRSATSSPMLRRLLQTAIACSVFVVGAWISFFAWSVLSIPTTISEPEIVCRLPEVIDSGTEVEGEIRIHNRQKTDLSRVSVELFLPPNIELLGKEGEDEEGERLTHFGRLPQQSDHLLPLHVQVVGAPKQTLSIQGRAIYQPTNTSSEFQTTFRCPITLSDTPLTLVTEGPRNITPGEEVSYRFSLSSKENNLSVVVHKLDIVWPKAFQILSITPPEKLSTPEQDPFIVTSIPFDKSLEWTVIGRVLATETGPAEIRAVISQTSPDGLWIPQQTTVSPLTIKEGVLSAHWTFQGRSNPPFTLQPGESIQARLVMKNTGDNVVQNLKVVAKWFDRSGRTVPIEWEKARLNKAQRVGTTLTWNDLAVACLKRLEPQKECVIDLVLPTASDIQPKEISDELQLTTQITSSLFGVQKDLSLEEQQLIFTSDLHLSTETTFPKEGVSERGAIPPVAGKPTTYRLVWALRNTLHPLEQVTVSSLLPPGVVFTHTSSVPAGTLTVDESTRRVEWRIDRWGTDMTELETWFDVTYTPQQEEIGTIPRLLHETSVHALDATTKERLNDRTPPTTTIVDAMRSQTGDKSGIVIAK